MDVIKQNEMELAHGQEAKPESNSDQTEVVNDEEFMVNQNQRLLRDIKKDKEIIMNSGIQVEKETNNICGGFLWSPLRLLKVKLAAKLMELFSGDNTEESLLKEIGKNILDLRKCYDEWVIQNYDDARLAGVLFLTGCAVLQFIRSYLRNELEKFEINSNQASAMVDELFDLKNQTPFRVLELLINLTNDPDQLRNEIVDFLYMNIMVAPMNDLSGHKKRTDILQIKKQNVHLLDLLHTLILLGNIEYVGRNNNNNNNKKCLSPCYNQQDIKGCLPRFDCCCRRRPPVNDSLKTRHHDYKRFFRNVQELKSAGIEFKPGSSFAISFESRCFNIRAHLRLPPIIVDESTERRLLNMVEYEMSLGSSSTKNCYIITSYIKFMDFLIDREQDVQELRAARIVWNRLSTDKEVADLFNKLGSTCRDPPQDAYSKVRTEIQTHCDRKCATWMAQVYYQHFSSPWTMVALLAAAIVLSLTFIQTWYAIHPKN